MPLARERLWSCLGLAGSWGSGVLGLLAAVCGTLFRAAHSPHKNFRVIPCDLFGPFFDHFFRITFLAPKLTTCGPKLPKVTPKGTQK